MSVKLIAIDMDGTLLNEHSELNPATIEAVHAAKAQGIKVVICTGRPLSGVTPFLKQLDLSGDDNYVITFNGSMAQTVTGKIITSLTLSHEDYIDIEALSRKLNIHCHVESEDHIYTANRDISPYTVGESSLVNMQIRYRTPDEMRPDLPIVKAMLIDHPDLLEAASQKIPTSFHDRFHIVRSAPYFLEILNNQASKGRTLKALAEYLHFNAAEVMAIGDQGNDLSMLEYATNSVAMGNGIPEAKQIAKYETKTNVEDGVAYAIRQWALA
ncbi:sugar-phosphatase [Lactiplantibacillus garii]|uniref:Sugar-phosphatase n=1 Tax=Lactiplantibacillus garii TaxID=2306423 RepID=A0A3R8KL99_9LACO|nr:sugar-phosphatase [Lactiplantibacillus garii]RRK10376.1 sugar-phosphatase [Lactiplantibacillus garii]